jgi:competence ComEA-like helix-hairpin-helix protein
MPGSWWKALMMTGLSMGLFAQDDLPAGKGKVILENTCTECHGLDKALNALRTERQWRDVAVRMRSKGATMTDDELKTLVEYLAQNFGAAEESSKPEGKVNINQATAREMESSLQLRSADTAAIVRYREVNGPFREWRDLTKVEGIDRARLEAVKDRIVFR